VEPTVDSAALLDLDPWTQNIALHVARSLEFCAASCGNVSGHLPSDDEILSLDVALHSPTLFHHNLGGLDSTFDATSDSDDAIADAIADNPQPRANSRDEAFCLRARFPAPLHTV
jgi:hypothetical protein